MDAYDKVTVPSGSYNQRRPRWWESMLTPRHERWGVYHIVYNVEVPPLSPEAWS